VTGPEHYVRAEQLLHEVRDGHREGTDVAAILAAAQAHAALAHAAAAALSAPDRGASVSDVRSDRRAWEQTAAVEPDPLDEIA
jgi:hypothetical protein